MDGMDKENEAERLGPWRQEGSCNVRQLRSTNWRGKPRHSVPLFHLCQGTKNEIPPFLWHSMCHDLILIQHDVKIPEPFEKKSTQNTQNHGFSDVFFQHS